MDIVKAFNDNKLNIQINIQGTYEEPMFRASDIGLVLDIKNFHTSISDFDETQKVLRSMDTLGGSQSVVFLTEYGLYELLFRSRKEIAKKFKKWVCQVIKEIRTNGKYELEQQLTIKDEEHTKQLKNTNKQHEDNLIHNFKEKLAVYLILVEESVVKFGHTKDIELRLKQHRSEFGPDIILKSIFETKYNREFEKLIKQNPEISKRVFSKVYKNNQTELIRLDADYTLENLTEDIENLKKTINGELIDNLIKENSLMKSEYEKEISELKEEILDLRLEISELKVNLELHEKDKEEDIKNIEKEKNEEIKELKKYEPKDTYITRNIKTGEIEEFRSYEAVSKGKGIGPHSLRDNYLDKPKVCRGYTFYTKGKKHWIPPNNFIHYEDIKASTHMKMCKSINKETEKVMYYNSIVEAARYIGLDITSDTERRKLTRAVSEELPCNDTRINVHKWSLLTEDIGKWVNYN